MDGMKKSYLFIALAQGVVGVRTFACWCHACMQAAGRGQGSLDSKLCCAECVSQHLQWQERSCARQDAAGLANARQKAQGYARKLAGQLQNRLRLGRVLVAVQNRGEDDPDQYTPALEPRPLKISSPEALHLRSPPALAPRYWLGWATRVVKTHEVGGSVAGTRMRYDKGDLEIEIEPWLTRDVSGGDERRIFRRWMATDAEAGGVADPGPEAGRVYTVNSTELRAVDITLQPVGVVGGAPLGVVARERRQAAVACDARRRSLPGVAQPVRQVMAALPRELWEVSAADENLILSNCW
jgi:hypothetical protein